MFLIGEAILEIINNFQVIKGYFCPLYERYTGYHSNIQ